MLVTKMDLKTVALFLILKQLILITRSQEIISIDVSESSEVINDDFLEENIVIEEDLEGEVGSGNSNDIIVCDTGSGEQEDKPDLSVTASASYTMTGSSGLNIDISLQRMSDNSVQMVCNMQETVSDDPEVEGSGESRLSSSSSFPSDLYLIKDIAVCNDLATAVGNDITTDAIKLAQVSGAGEATEAVSVTWAEVSDSNCMAMLKQKPAEDDANMDVVVEFRTPRQSCRRRDSILTPYLTSRAFTSLNLAGFALVSVGVTSAFAVASTVVIAQASSPSSSNQEANFQNINLQNAIWTITPLVVVYGIYLLTGRIPARKRRRNDSFKRKKATKLGQLQFWLQFSVKNR